MTEMTAHSNAAITTAPQSLQSLETLFQSAIIVLDTHQTVIYFNPLALILFETSEEILKKKTEITSFFTFLSRRGDITPETYSDFTKYLKSSVRHSSSNLNAPCQGRLQLPSGRTLKIQLIQNSDGTYIFSATDISSESRHNDVLNLAMRLSCAGYWVFKHDGTSLEFHSEYLKTILTPKEFDKAISEGIWPFFHKEDFPHAEQLWNSVVSENMTQEGTVRIITKRHGIRWMRFHLMAQNMGAQSQKDIICFFTDVTDTLRQNEDLRFEKESAEQKLRDKNDYLARMSHEIRTPMNGVIGIADALIHHNGTPEINSKLELIQSSAGNIMRILDETLDHTKLNSETFSLAPELADPAKVVRNVCKLWEQQALKNGCFIRCIIKPGVPDMITFDRYRYEQCVNNLLSNAVKFTPKGNIDVVLMVARKPDRPTRLILAVRDTGIGMTEKQQSKIFDAYSQGDETITSRFGGTGLGMNITKQIIELMGGTITVKSEADKGSIFALAFPIEDVAPSVKEVDTAAPQPQKKASTGLVSEMLEAAQPADTPYSNLKILVVDDNATNHVVINSLLGSVVGEIFNANNGREALDVLETTDIDIVLMDIHMPVMDGIEATITIRSSTKPWKGVQIIALTADPQYQQKKLCLNIGMDEALAKPVKLNDLLQAIDNVLAAIKVNEQARPAA